jgi:uncharacterized membrane protein affecting hemolysin expression
MKLATFISAGAILASAGFGSAAKHVETNAVSVLANDGAGDPAGSRKQGNETTVEAECVLLGYLRIAVDAHVSLLNR